MIITNKTITYYAEYDSNNNSIGSRSNRKTWNIGGKGTSFLPSKELPTVGNIVQLSIEDLTNLLQGVDIVISTVTGANDIIIDALGFGIQTSWSQEIYSSRFCR
jgi:hypothetical protein